MNSNVAAAVFRPIAHYVEVTEVELDSHYQAIQNGEMEEDPVEDKEYPGSHWLPIHFGKGGGKRGPPFLRSSKGKAKGKGKGKSGTCHRCGRPGHWKRECPLGKGKGSGTASLSAAGGQKQHLDAEQVAADQPSCALIHHAVGPGEGQPIRHARSLSLRLFGRRLE